MLNAALQMTSYDVCLCVGHTDEADEFSENGRTDRDAVREQTRLGPRNLVIDGWPVPHKKPIFDFMVVFPAGCKSVKVMCAAAMRPFAVLLWIIVNIHVTILTNEHVGRG